MLNVNIKELNIYCGLCINLFISLYIINKINY